MNVALLCFFFGVWLLFAGIWWIYPPAALITAGAILISLAVMFGVTKKAQ